MFIKVDLDKCQGFANCVMAAPDTFDLDDQSLVVVLTDVVVESELADVEEAVRSCPVEALRLERA